MPLTDGEFASILSDDTKRIDEDLAWTEDDSCSERYRDKEAYVPTDVAAPVSDPV